MVEIETFIGIALGIVAIATVGYSIAKGQFRSEQRHSNTAQKLESELLSIKLKVDVIWRIFEEQLPKLLIRPTHKELDMLIEKYTEHQATREEMIRLRDLIDEELEKETDKTITMVILFMKPTLEHNIANYR